MGRGKGGLFVFSQVQLLGLNRWHPLAARGQGGRCGRGWAGARGLADRAIASFCPDRSKGRGLHCYPQWGSHLGCHQGCLGDISRRG